MSELRSDLAIGAGWQHASLGRDPATQVRQEFARAIARPKWALTRSMVPVGVVGTHSVALTNGPTLIVGRKETSVPFSITQLYLAGLSTPPISLRHPPAHNLRYYKYLLDSLNLVKLDRSTAIPGLSRDD